MTGDDLDALLTPRPVPPDPAAKEALFRRTARVHARRRVLRRAGAVVAVGLVFAAGLGVGRRTAPESPAPAPVLLPVPVPVPAPESPSAPLALSAPQLELEAEKATDPTVAATLFRRAGDKYLADLGDIPAATRCYASHLAETGSVGRSVAAEDSWLLIRMKVSRSKENGNEPNAGT